MRKEIKMAVLISCIAFSYLIMAFSEKKAVTIYLIGDSTMADYANNYDPGKDYMKTRYPVTGWGQVFQRFLVKDSLQQVKKLIKNR